MLTLIKHAIASIAIADVLSNEKIGIPIREKFGIRHNNTGDPYAYDDDSFVSSMLWCIFCTSYWVSGALAVLYFISKPLHGFITLLFGGAWLGGLLFRIRNKFL